MEWIFQNSGIITTVLFFSVFVLVIVWTYFFSKKTTMDAHARIPLEEQINGE